MNKCYWCGKPSTRLCDFPVDGEETLNEQGEKVFDIGVCSKPICEECATKYHGLDVCPSCMGEVAIWVLERKDRIFELGKRRAGNGRN